MRLLDNITRADTRMFLWATGSRYQTLLAKFARAVSRTGDGYLQVALPLALVAFAVPGGVPFLQAVVIAFAFQLPVYWVLKNSFKRRRPPVAIPSFDAFIVASDEFSFPSGHTSAAFVLAILLTSFFGTVAAPFFVWAVMVGCSRVLLGVHFPTDILAGIVLAFCSSTLSLHLLSLI